MAGWVPVESDSDIPQGFCFSDQLTAIPCQTSFFSFHVLTAGTSSGVCFAKGEANATGLVSNFSAIALHRYAFRGSDMVFSTKTRDAYWSINEAGQLSMQPQEQATKFKMYKRANGQGPIVIRSGKYFVGVGLSGLYVTQTVCSDHLLLPAQQQHENIVADMDKMDAEIMGYRVNSLLNGGKLFPAWMAYDYALVIPLRNQPNGPKFTQFKMENAGPMDLMTMFNKAFELIALKMIKEYSHYPSLGRQLPKDLMVHQIAESIPTTAPDVWHNVASVFVIYGEDDYYRADFFLGVAAFAAAKFKATANDNQILLSPKEEKAETWMASYYRTSSALAWMRPGLTLMQKLNQTDMLVDTTNMGLLTRPMDGTLKKYWFTDLLKKPEDPEAQRKQAGNRVGDIGTTPTLSQNQFKEWNTSRTLMELGLMYHLDAKFIAESTTIGESISEPIFKEIDRGLTASAGMDLDSVYRLVSDNTTRDMMDVVDAICRAKLVEINVCVLPQIFRQTGLFSMYSRNITSPSVVTSLETTTSIDYSKYLKLVQEDAAAADLKANLLKAKREFIQDAKTLTDGLSQRVEDSVIKTALDASQQIAATTSALTKFMEKTSSFQAKGLNAQLSQRMTEIEEGQKRVDSTRSTFLEELNAIATIAKIRASIEAFVKVVDTAFSVFDFGEALGVGRKVKSQTTKGEFERDDREFDLGSAGGVVSGFEQSIQAINTVSNTFKLKEYADGLAKELGSVIQRMQQLAPAITRVREAAAPLISGEKLSTAQLASISEKFLEAMKDYKAPVSVTELNSLQSRFQAVGDQLCIVAELPTDRNCINLPGRNEMIFTVLVENVRSGEDAMQALMDMCAEAINAQTLQVLDEKVKQNAAEATDLTALQRKWGKDENKKKEWWFQWNKKQSYLTAAATAGTVLQQVYMLSALVAKCNEETYLNGGVPSATCKNVIYSGQSIQMENVASLTAPVKRAGTWTTVSPSTSLIPTEPSYPGDLAYIDLAKLLDGQPVYFKLPLNNATWLKNHGWVSLEADVSKYVYLVKSFQLFLPPRFADYSSSPGSAEIVVESRPLSNLGPGMQGKTYLIKPVKYKTEYTYGDGGVSEDSCQALSYHQCNRNLPQYCLRSDGLASVTSGLLPSLFSEWVITAKVEGSGGSAPRIGYRKASTPLLLQAQVQMDRLLITSARASSITSDNVAVPTVAPSATPAAVTPVASVGVSDSPAPALAPVPASGAADPATPEAASPSPAAAEGSVAPAAHRQLRYAAVQAGSTIVGERAVKAGSTKVQCCAPGTEYRGKDGCMACPKGSISQLGGLYCVPDPKLTRGQA
ncbi:hypothetical protein Poli38472_000912 [Pythium oligandrum]|uniref:Uncharacterized protein n=1 Tax=Pythium oligandrum TaxID=41045 RepID=A0A8K1FES6_PYTOL|nr:hypothetical protein Poli38472_000912 [Pythium oligandrum]|eukprot:TMW60870.1 hypothetical protein Poli38472_000912 [Pythium oligandrum]